MKPQLFHRGDMVRVAKDLGSSMSHFRADADAIVIGSYRDQYRGENGEDYTLLFCDDGNQVSWYHERQLTLIRHAGEAAIVAILDARKSREAVETQLPWIVENWNRFKAEGQYPGASVNELMRLIGIVNPWGDRGEGLTYLQNAYGALGLLKQSLETGNLAAVQARIEEIKTLAATQP